jgi:hypothetical protein
MEGVTKCALHGGPMMVRAKQREALRMYRLGKYQARVSEFAENEAVKSLREEIGLARLLMESVISICHTESDLLSHHSRISDLLIKIERLVTSCHRLEAATGVLIDKSAALHLAAGCVEIIAKYITDEDVLDKVGSELMELVKNSNFKSNPEGSK